MSSLSLPDSPSLRDSFANAARFWETRRVLYNLILFLVCVIWVAASWPHFRPAMHWFNLFRMAVLALLANLCYTAAYVVDLPLAASTGRSSRQRWRWTLWLAGTLLAVLLANYWIADEIYPDVH
jgi:hypothetical protein